MKLYKPFEYLFYSIETFYILIGVGGFYNKVALAVATLQLFNLMVVFSIISKILGLDFTFFYLVISYPILLIFNWIYFKEDKIDEIMEKYSKESKVKKRLFGILTIMYIIISFIMLPIFI